MTTKTCPESTAQVLVTLSLNPKQVDKSPIQFLDLPTEILLLIVDRFAHESLPSFRRVGRSCYNVSLDALKQVLWLAHRLNVRALTTTLLWSISLSIFTASTKWQPLPDLAYKIAVQQSCSALHLQILNCLHVTLLECWLAASWISMISTH